MAGKIEIRKSARLGTLSVVFGCLPLFLLCILAFALYAANKITYDHDVKNGIAILLTGHFFFFAPLLHFVGLVLGIVAVFLRRQKKPPAVFGIVLNVILPATGIVLTLFWALLSAVPPVR